MEEKVQKLEEQILNETQNKSGDAKQKNKSASLPAKLYQNNPNPFSNDTEIKFYLPENITNAFLYI